MRKAAIIVSLDRIRAKASTVLACLRARVRDPAGSPHVSEAIAGISRNETRMNSEKAPRAARPERNGSAPAATPRRNQSACRSPSGARRQPDSSQGRRTTPKRPPSNRMRPISRLKKISHPARTPARIHAAFRPVRAPQARSDSDPNTNNCLSLTKGQKERVSRKATIDQPADPNAAKHATAAQASVNAAVSAERVRKVSRLAPVKRKAKASTPPS